MKAILTCDVELTLVTGLNREQEPIEEIEVFRKGTELDFDLIDYGTRFKYDEVTQKGEWVEDRTFWNIQFPDGSMVFGVSCEWLEIKQ
jgi:hypothetical protein